MNIRQQQSATSAPVGRDDHGVTDNAVKLRSLAAAGVAVSAAIHLYLWLDGFRHTDIVGPAFLLNAVGGTIIAVLLVTWRHWIALLLAIGFGASTLGAFIVAATAGLFGVHENWTSWEVWTAAATEVIAVAAAGTVLLVRENPSA
jgi:hypothetical protein